jgi:pimeloyl-ACP methyl ester carboxylesterase
VARTAAGQQVVLVHGIGGGAWFFFEVMTLLNAAGFSATAVDLSSNGISKAIADDITSIEQYTQPLTDLLSTIDGQVRGDSRLIHNSLLLAYLLVYSWR